MSQGFNIASDRTAAADRLPWDAAQLAVIALPKSERVIVDAGPGTGKTAVACARVAHLVNQQGCVPQGVWLISFTRTAVKEVRDRIAMYLDDPQALYGIRIATVDSQAWSIHYGFRPETAAIGSFDHNIERALQLVEQDEEVQAFLQETEHLVVDEAQDLVGPRADLVAALVARLRPDAGVTVFTDPAQAIYGFASDAERGGRAAAVSRLEDVLVATQKFSKTSLDEIHRTKVPGLRQIFGPTRAMVLTRTDDPARRNQNVRDAIAASADNTVDKIFDPDLRFANGTFVLFRRRSEALMAASFLRKEGTPHRLRMSGLPTAIPSWIGATLAGFSEPSLTEKQFADLWKRAHSSSTAGDGASEWTKLEEMAPTRRTGTVDVRLLRDLLARAQPPAELVSPDLGTDGPIIGTIHAAKGREADNVWLMMPMLHDAIRDRPDEVDLDEETRVVFVGATRARTSLTVARGYRAGGASNLEGSGRVHEIKREAGFATVEIGRSGDVRAEGMVGRTLYATEADAAAVQRRLAELPSGRFVRVRADLDRRADFTYRLTDVADEAALGALSPTVNADLFEVARRIQKFKGGGDRRTPDYLQYLSIMGARTIVLRPDDPDLERLHEPWRSSGILLAPVVLGYTKTFFPFKK